MQTIELSYDIIAPLDRIWWALSTAEGAEQWGAGPATFDASEGGEFRYWDGDIHGINTKIVPLETIEQDWYGHEHPEEKYRAIFNLHQEGDTTTVQLRYSGNIYDEQRDITDWKDYYFDPIKKLLET